MVVSTCNQSVSFFALYLICQWSNVPAFWFLAPTLVAYLNFKTDGPFPVISWKRSISTSRCLAFCLGRMQHISRLRFTVCFLLRDTIKPNRRFVSGVKPSTRVCRSKCVDQTMRYRPTQSKRDETSTTPMVGMRRLDAFHENASATHWHVTSHQTLHPLTNRCFPGNQTATIFDCGAEKEWVVTHTMPS